MYFCCLVLQRQHSEPGRPLIWPSTAVARSFTTAMRHSHHFPHAGGDLTAQREPNFRSPAADGSCHSDVDVYQTTRGSTRIGDFFPPVGGTMSAPPVSWEGVYYNSGGGGGDKPALNRSQSVGSSEYAGQLAQRLNRQNNHLTAALYHAQSPPIRFCPSTFFHLICLYFLPTISSV